MAHQEDVDEDAEITRIRNTLREWRAEAARHGKPLRLPVVPFLLRNIWMGALLLFSALTFSTFFINTVAQVRVQSPHPLLHPQLRILLKGDRLHQSGRHMLVGCDVGTFCYHHGSEYPAQHCLVCSHKYSSS